MYEFLVNFIDNDLHLGYITYPHVPSCRRKPSSVNIETLLVAGNSSHLHINDNSHRKSCSPSPVIGMMWASDGDGNLHKRSIQGNVTDEHKVVRDTDKPGPPGTLTDTTGNS